MTRFQRSGSWRRALSAGAACGLVLAGAAFAAETPNGVRDSSEAGTKSISSSGEADLDAAFQTLGVTTTKPGSSSYATRKLAIADLPMSELSPDATSKVNGILSNVAMFRRLPTLSFEVDPDVYTYLLKNPDVAVSTWRAMEISKFQLKEYDTGCFDADAGDGSVGRIQILRQTPLDTIIYCDGAFKSPLLPRPIVAKSLMRLQTSFAKEPDGRIMGTHSGEVFVEFPSQAVETVAKVISPVSHSIADRNFKQITLYVHLMTLAMAKHPGWIEQIGNKLDGVTPAQRQKFMEVSARSHVLARKRHAAGLQGKPFAPDEFLTPFKISDETNSLPPPVAIRPASGTARD